jgi:DNA-binding response OmpR family regulator
MPTEPVKLLLISIDEECCAWVRAVLGDRADCCLRHLDGPDVSSVLERDRLAPVYEESHILIIDLDCTAANPMRFWASVRIAYGLKPVIGIVKATTCAEAQQAALGARLERFVKMGAPGGDLVRAAATIRRDNGLLGYFAVIEPAMALFQGAARKSPPHLILHRDQRKARLGSREITLASREFALLSYLAENPRRTIHTDELLAAVWKTPRERGGTTAQVKHCVHRLRKKIEPDQNCFTYLKTANGHGYWVENVEVV